MLQPLVELAHVFADAFLVALDREQIIATTLLDDDARGEGLRIEGIGGHQRTFKVRPAQERLGGGDFIGVLGGQFGSSQRPSLTE